MLFSVLSSIILNFAITSRAAVSFPMAAKNRGDSGKRQNPMVNTIVAITHRIQAKCVESKIPKILKDLLKS